MVMVLAWPQMEGARVLSDFQHLANGSVAWLDQQAQAQRLVLLKEQLFVSWRGVGSHQAAPGLDSCALRTRVVEKPQGKPCPVAVWVLLRPLLKVAVPAQHDLAMSVWVQLHLLQALDLLCSEAKDVWVPQAEHH